MVLFVILNFRRIYCFLLGFMVHMLYYLVKVELKKIKPKMVLFLMNYVSKSKIHDRKPSMFCALPPVPLRMFIQLPLKVKGVLLKKRSTFGKSKTPLFNHCSLNCIKPNTIALSHEFYENTVYFHFIHHESPIVYLTSKAATQNRFYVYHFYLEKSICHEPMTNSGIFREMICRS